MFQRYECPTCKATKMLVSDLGKTYWAFQQELPETILCGWRGCTNIMVKVNKITYQKSRGSNG